MMTSHRLPWLVWALVVGCTAWVSGGEPAPTAWLWRVPGAEGTGRWVADTHRPTGATGAVGRVWTGGPWPVGTVPLYGGARGGELELRRLPARGRESQEDPVGFVLPEAGDAGSAAVSGRWRVVSRKADGAVHRFGWELACDGAVVAGRFDPDTDFRYAHIVEGRHESGTLRLRVEYIEDRYEITGKLEAGVWRGDWQRPDGSEKGTWEARRADDAPVVRIPERGAAVMLVERRDRQGRQAGLEARPAVAAQGEGVVAGGEGTERVLGILAGGPGGP